MSYEAIADLGTQAKQAAVNFAWQKVGFMVGSQVGDKTGNFTSNRALDVQEIAQPQPAVANPHEDWRITAKREISLIGAELLYNGIAGQCSEKTLTNATIARVATSGYRSALTETLSNTSKEAVAEGISHAAGLYVKEAYTNYFATQGCDGMGMEPIIEGVVYGAAKAVTKTALKHPAEVLSLGGRCLSSVGNGMLNMFHNAKEAYDTLDWELLDQMNEGLFQGSPDQPEAPRPIR